jgi:quinol-cytochrome oxidoreductase complex cytochrome b subunit
MSGNSTYQPQGPCMRWLERRLPIAGLIHSSFVVYPTPRNLNYWWTFGGILTSCWSCKSSPASCSP